MRSIAIPIALWPKARRLREDNRILILVLCELFNDYGAGWFGLIVGRAEKQQEQE